MRIASVQREQIKKLIMKLVDGDASVLIFGSRVDDEKRGGDLDLLVEVTDEVTNSAWLAAQISAKVSRLMFGRKVDVLLSAPNLQIFPIHQHAKETGVIL